MVGVLMKMHDMICIHCKQGIHIYCFEVSVVAGNGFYREYRDYFCLDCWKLARIKASIKPIVLAALIRVYNECQRSPFYNHEELMFEIDE